MSRSSQIFWMAPLLMAVFVYIGSVTAAYVRNHSGRKGIKGALRVGVLVLLLTGSAYLALLILWFIVWAFRAVIP